VLVYDNGLSLNHSLTMTIDSKAVKRRITGYQSTSLPIKATGTSPSSPLAGSSAYIVSRMRKHVCFDAIEDAGCIYCLAMETKFSKLTSYLRMLLLPGITSRARLRDAIDIISIINLIGSFISLKATHHGI